MKKELIYLKNAVNEIATKIGVEIYELYTEEKTEISSEFGKKYAPLATEIFKDLLYSGEDIQISLISAVGRGRECDFAIEEIGFWEDMSIIVSLYESLEIRGHYRENHNAITNLVV